MRDMNTAREQREANTVEADTVQLMTRLRCAWRAEDRPQRNYLWSRPSRATMCAGPGISRAFGNERVPV
jgi:hypothetical protein